MTYGEFLEKKAQDGTYEGFEPIYMPGFLFDFQQSLVDWAIRKGKAAIFADCGLGKTPMELVWAENIVRKTKFGIEVNRSTGQVHGGINVTNYEKLHHFDPRDFAGCVCDESSAIKAMNGKRRAQVTEFLRTLPYRLLATATAAPNDYIELGTTSEALGVMGQVDMLNRFFKNDNNTSDTKAHWRGFAAPRALTQPGWRFKDRQMVKNCERAETEPEDADQAAMEFSDPHEEMEPVE